MQEGIFFFLICTEEEGVNDLIPHRVCYNTLKHMVTKQEARQQEHKQAAINIRQLKITTSSQLLSSML